MADQDALGLLDHAAGLQRLAQLPVLLQRRAVRVVKPGEGLRGVVRRPRARLQQVGDVLDVAEDAGDGSRNQRN